MRFKSLLVLVLAACPAQAQDPHWADVGGWTISVDPIRANGCYLVSSFAGGTNFGLGFDRRDDTGYMFISDTDWTSLVNDQSYDLTVKFGRRSPWDGQALAVISDAGENFLTLTVDSDFMEEFANQNEVRMNFGPAEIAFLGLQGSRRALNEMIACQDAWDAAGPSDPFAGAAGADPFAKKSGIGADPFAQ